MYIITVFRLIHILKLYCIPAAVLIKTHFECLRAFLLFLISFAVMEQL